MQRRQAGRLLSSLWRRHCSSAASLPPAFVFDIDGVLIRGGEVLEPAKRALAKLYAGDGQQPRFPVAFLTNGGGCLEAEKAAQLSGWLGVNVTAEQVVLSHTPFKTLVPRLQDQPVLLAGRHDIAAVAAAYGFRRCATTAQLAAAHPHAVPFARGSARSCDAASTSYGTEAHPIRAVLVFSDPSCWYTDLQILTDVITSGGVMGRREPTWEGGEAAPVEVFFSNPDKVFANEHPSPRFGQGAFAIALRALLTQVAEQREVRWKVFGKPNPEPYALATEALRAQAAALGLPQQFGSIWMVGDNPSSDVAGARAAGPPWCSGLVRTGVFRGGANATDHPADLVVADVEAAVDAALHRARAARWHSMR